MYTLNPSTRLRMTSLALAMTVKKVKNYLKENWLKDISREQRHLIAGLSRQQQQYLVESDGNKLRKRIAEAKTMKELHEAEAVVQRMAASYGSTPQVVAMQGSLGLALLQKGMEIAKTERGI